MIKALFLSLMAAASASVAQAHDLGGTRARLVQYDNRHLTMTLLVRLSDVIQQQSANREQYRARMLTLAAMKQDDFAREMAKLELHLAAETRIRLNGGSEGAISHWRWPDPATAQAQVRAMVMNAVSGGMANGLHEEPLEADAEVSSTGVISVAAMKFPREFGPVVMVAYRPVQVIVTAADYSQRVHFPDVTSVSPK